MADIEETIGRLEANFVIVQGKYDLTADAMSLRRQRPLHCGDKYTFEFELIDEDGLTPVDLTGCTIKFTAKYAYEDADPGIIQKDGVIVNPPGTDGLVRITIAKGDVAGPEAIYGYYDLQVVDGSGDPETFIYGDIEWLPQVTIAT